MTIETIADCNYNICYRITRECNLKCWFCQAPPRNGTISIKSHFQAIKEIALKGVSSFKFTGGEPTIHPDFIEILYYAHSLKLDITICSNGFELKNSLIEALKIIKPKLKISLNGPDCRHNPFIDRTSFAKTYDNIKWLISEDIHPSIHTMIFNDFPLNNWINYLNNIGIKKISFLVFVERGRASNIRNLISKSQLDILKTLIEKAKQDFPGCDIRFLDFRSKPYLVFETDGNIYLQKNMESEDKFIEKVLYPTF